MRSLWTLALALIASNYAYQAFAGHDWLIAFERSWYQCVAVGLSWWVKR